MTDVNDNPPRFDHPAYEVTISDLAERGQFVTVVMATDDDASDVGRLAYSIVGGNTRQAFMLDAYSGILSLSSLRKPSLDSEYLLNVSVTDGVFTNFAIIHVTVDNSNQFAPAFDSDEYDFDVSENLPVDSYIATVTAQDQDRGLYGEIRYSIVSQESLEAFRMEDTTGAIYTQESLDREEKAQYLLAVAATDGGGRMSYVNVRINVADQGDHPPRLRLGQYKANVRADAPVGTVILMVSPSIDFPVLLNIHEEGFCICRWRLLMRTWDPMERWSLG